MAPTGSFILQHRDDEQCADAGNLDSGKLGNGIRGSR